MSRTSDILNKAQNLRKQHQNVIDNKLKKDIQTALQNTEDFVTQRVNTISKDMDIQIALKTTDLKNSLQIMDDTIQTQIRHSLIQMSMGVNRRTTDLKNSLQIMDDTIQTQITASSTRMSMKVDQTEKGLQNNLQSKTANIQTKINTVETKLTKDTQEIQADLKQQIQNMRKELQTFSELSQATVEQVKMKKLLFSSNIVLASIIPILLILIICFGYISKSKYKEIKNMQTNINYLESKGGKWNMTTCDNQPCIQIDTSKPEYEGGFRIVK